MLYSSGNKITTTNHDVLLVGVAGGGTPLSTREPPTTANNM